MGAVRLDLHVHSRHSPDSSLTIDEIVAGLASAGLNGFALTDHNTVAGHAELGALQARFPDVVLVPGVEVSTIEGHLLAYGVTEAPPPRRPVRETIDWVRAHGGVPALPHPFRRSHGVGRALTESLPVAAIETLNGHNSPAANRRAAEVALQRKIPGTGGSDVHGLADLGRAFTVFEDGAATADAVLAAMRAGRMTPGGASLALPGRMRTGMRSFVLRLRRGFRPI